MDTWSPLRWSLIICYFLWVSHVRVCLQACVFLQSRHSSSRNLRRCDLRDTGFCSFWGLRGAEVSEFQFPPNSHSQSHTLTLCISLTQPNTLYCLHSYPSRACFFLLSLSAINTVSYFLCSIHKVPKGEILSHTTVLYCPLAFPFSLPQTKHSLFLFTLSF